jgi:peptidase E
MGGGQDADDPIWRELAALTGAARPRVLYVPTATGDAAANVAAFYRRFPATSFEPSDLPLFLRTEEDLRERVLAQDLVLVGGGNTAAMLAVWRVHGLDAVLREAWGAGVVLAGGSAGANCWFEACTTDSFLLGRADPLRDGLGLLAGSFCPHYDSEPSRRPSYLGQVAAGDLPAGVAADDLAAVRYEGTALAEVLVSSSAARAVRVVSGGGGGALEEPLPSRRL